MNQLGPLLASGRDSDVFEYGKGLVLRRSREGNSMANEARTMEYVREHGYPVPRVHEVSDGGTDLVMERVDGPLMVAAAGRRPWSIRHQGEVLAELHQRLHEIPAPDWVRDSPGAAGDRMLHLDLHPLNVLLSPTGPIVIDWSNAARGDGHTDVALTWLLLATGTIPGGALRARVMGWGRSVLVNAFLAAFNRHEVRAQLPAVVAWKLADPHMSAVEREAMKALVLGNE